MTKTDESTTEQTKAPSYHDLHITTEQIPRTSIFDLPYGIEVICARTSGWSAWNHNEQQSPITGSTLPGGPVMIAGEYDDNWLVLDVAGHVIVDSRGRERDER